MTRWHAFTLVSGLWNLVWAIGLVALICANEVSSWLICFVPLNLAVGWVATCSALSRLTRERA